MVEEVSDVSGVALVVSLFSAGIATTSACKSTSRAVFLVATGRVASSTSLAGSRGEAEDLVRVVLVRPFAAFSLGLLSPLPLKELMIGPVLSSHGRQPTVHY